MIMMASLSNLDKIRVFQKLEVLEIVSGFQTKNKYFVENDSNQLIYFAVEESSAWSRLFCAACRPFQLHLYDILNKQVITLDRPYRFCCQFMEVRSPPEKIIGTIEQKSCHRFVVKMASGEEILFIKKIICPCKCTLDVNFQILLTDMTTEIGKLTKISAGCVQEAYSNADNFSLTFPLDMDVNVKTLLLGAIFLIDFVYFEI